MNELNTKADCNIFPFGSYDFLVVMGWLDQHRVVLDCHKNTFTFLDEEGNMRTIQGIPRAVAIKEISER
jgi:hypothetical protein